MKINNNKKIKNNNFNSNNNNKIMNNKMINQKQNQKMNNNQHKYFVMDHHNQININQ